MEDLRVLIVKTENLGSMGESNASHTKFCVPEIEKFKNNPFTLFKERINAAFHET